MAERFFHALSTRRRRLAAWLRLAGLRKRSVRQNAASLQMKKSDATRARILDRALVLFRKNGFDRTTMREIAEAAGLALGAAYYYFPSKESLLLAYYARNQLEHESRTAAALAAAHGLRDKLGVLMHEKLNAVKRERKLLGAMVQRLADPADPISAFAKQTRDVRQQSMSLFARALESEPLSAELKRLVVPALWMLHMGFLLYFIHDRSPAQAKTHRARRRHPRPDHAADLPRLDLPDCAPGRPARPHPLERRAGLSISAWGRVSRRGRCGPRRPTRAGGWCARWRSRAAASRSRGESARRDLYWPPPDAPTARTGRW